jgi:hypothetical protein
VTQAEAEYRIVYEGPSEGAEAIMGATLANFIIEGPGADKECGVMLNDPGAAYLAERLGVEQTPEWREQMTKRVGEVVLDAALQQKRHIDSVVFVSRAILEAHPEYVEALRAG